MKRAVPPVLVWRDKMLESAIPSHTKLVLMVLACHMDSQGGKCYPSQNTVALLASLSRKAAGQHLRLAEKSGWVKCRFRKIAGSKWASKEYEMAYPASHEYGASAKPESADNDGNLLPNTPKTCDGNLVPVCGEFDGLRDGKRLPTNTPAEATREAVTSQERSSYSKLKDAYAGAGDEPGDADWEVMLREVCP